MTKSEPIINEGDMFVFTESGITKLSIFKCAKISRSWFRWIRPYKFQMLLSEGNFVSTPMRSSYIWVSEGDVRYLLKESTSMDKFEYLNSIVYVPLNSL